MFTGNGRPDCSKRLIFALATDERWGEPVAGQALGATKLKPVGQDIPLASKDAKQRFLMVAAEKYCLPIAWLPCA